MLVTAHAVDRYRERVADVPPIEARRVLEAHQAVIDVAARFGCPVVILAGGVRLKLAGDVVVTVVRAERKKGRK